MFIFEYIDYEAYSKYRNSKSLLGETCLRYKTWIQDTICAILLFQTYD